MYRGFTPPTPPASRWINSSSTPITLLGQEPFCLRSYRAATVGLCLSAERPDFRLGLLWVASVAIVIKREGDGQEVLHRDRMPYFFHPFCDTLGRFRVAFRSVQKNDKAIVFAMVRRSEEHTSELQSRQ